MGKGRHKPSSASVQDAGPVKVLLYFRVSYFGKHSVFMHLSSLHTYKEFLIGKYTAAPNLCPRSEYVFDLNIIRMQVK